MRALIWDLDGTILDSYGVIVDCTHEALREAGIEIDRRELHTRLIASSVKTVLEDFEARQGLTLGRFWERYQVLNVARDDEVKLMDGAAETLERLSKTDIPSFVYTHKGATARAVLQKLGVLRYFTDVLSAEAGLPRKPAPDGLLWLIKRYDLDKNQTFYVGDRPIDVECALNAHVRSILYRPPESPAVPTGREDHIVADLRQIPGLFAIS